MALVRWEPTREISSLQGEMNRLFSTFFDTPAEGAGARRWIPPMDLVETADAFVLRADVPGVEQEDVSVEVEDRVLTVSGERRAEQEDRREGYHRIERAFGAFRRSVTLPEGVQAQEVTARFHNGVLEVRIPKPAEREPHRVAIEVAGGQAAIEGTEAPPAEEREGEPATV